MELVIKRFKDTNKNFDLSKYIIDAYIELKEKKFIDSHSGACIEGRSIAAFIDGKIVGVFKYGVISSEEFNGTTARYHADGHSEYEKMHIDIVYISPEHRKKGIYKLLLDELIYICKKDQALNYITIVVYSNNKTMLSAVNGSGLKHYSSFYRLEIDKENGEQK